MPPKDTSLTLGSATLSTGTPNPSQTIPPAQSTVPGASTIQSQTTPPPTVPVEPKPDMKAQLDAIQKQALAIKDIVDKQVASEQAGGGTGTGVLNAPDTISSAATQTQDTMKSLQDLETMVKGEMAKLQDPAQQQESFVNLYNDLRNQQNLPALDSQVVNLQNIMNGTENDIRNEIGASGGFATESQIQALTATRNKVLTQQLNAISNVQAMKQGYVDKIMTLTGQDRTAASQQFDKLTGLQDKLLTLENTINNSGFKNTLAYQTYFQKDSAAAQKEMDTMIKQGTLGQLTADQITSYANRTGFTEDQIRAAMTNTDARYELQTQILNNKLTTASGLLSSLSPDALNLLSSMFLTTGNIPSIGYGQAGVLAKTQIIDNAAQKAAAQDLTGADIAAQGAAFAANKSALSQLSKLQAATNVYEANANKNFDQLIGLSKKVDRTGSPVLNKYLLYLNGQIKGDADTQAFQSVLVGAAAEYAKVITGSLGSAAVTDSSRQEVEKALNASLSDGTFNKVISQLRIEMSNRTKGFKEEVANLNDKLKNSSGSTSPIPSSVDIPPSVDSWAKSLNIPIK